MKQKARKLLSLLMAFAIVCSMIPAALAEGEGGGKNPTPVTHDPETHTTFTYKKNGANTHLKKCASEGCPYEVTEDCSAEATASYEHNAWSHYKSCQHCKELFGESNHVKDASKGEAYYNDARHSYTCSVCGYAGCLEEHDKKYESVSGTQHKWYCTLCQNAETDYGQVENHRFVRGVCLDCGHKAAEADYTLEISGADVVGVGQTISLTAVVKDGAGAPVAPQPTVTWSSGSQNVSVSDSGSVTGLQVGSAKITATASFDNGATVSDSIVIDVVEAVESLTLNPTSLTLNVGQSATIAATTVPTGVEVFFTSSDRTVATVTPVGGEVTAKKAGTATITAKAGDKTATCTVTVTDKGISISVSKATLTSLRDEATLKVTATGFPTTVDTSKTTWSVSSGSSYVDLSRSTGTSITVYPVSKGTATIKASLTVDGTTYSDTCTIKVSYSTEIEAEAMVYNTNPGYGLGEVDDDGEDSVIDQIYDAVRSVSGKRESLYYVTFDTVRVSGKGELDASTKDEYYYDEDDAEDERGELLSDVVFTPDEDYEGDVSFTFKAYYDTGRNDYYTGVVTFEVKEGEAADGGDILYMAQKGDDVELDVEDFEEFWNDEYSKGSLEYVVFTSVSSGSLYDADDDKLSRDEECYVEPGKRQTALEGVYFTPKKNFTGAVTIGFTATGTTKSSSKTTSDLKGNVLILYTDGEVSDIDYQISANAEVTLDDADFTAIYKDATDTSSKNPTVYIRFLEVPKNGTLYYNYNSKTGRGTELKTSNIGRYFFSNKSSASYGIEDVTYVANSKGTADSIKYAAYSSSSSGSLQYIGTINFGGTSSTPVTVSLNCTSTSLRFQSSTFYAGTSLLTTSSYIVFGTPTSGTLYKNYTGTTGTRVSNADHFAYSTSSALGVQAISTLTYVPATGYTGVVEIPFTSYNVKGGTTSGTVRINVTAVRVTFSDLSTTNWAYQYVAPLAAAGVINGYEDGTFRPANNVTYAEILKMVMLATGYSEQAKTGSHWASGYMSRAITDGILSGQVSLDSAADRNAVAAIVAKAMKLSPITTGYNPFADSTDGYARALYNAGIITGYVENNKTYYKGSTLISRAEIATIIFRVSNAYHG